MCRLHTSDITKELADMQSIWSINLYLGFQFMYMYMYSKCKCHLLCALQHALHTTISTVTSCTSFPLKPDSVQLHYLQLMVTSFTPCQLAIHPPYIQIFRHFRRFFREPLCGCGCLLEQCSRDRLILYFWAKSDLVGASVDLQCRRL